MGDARDISNLLSVGGMKKVFKNGSSGEPFILTGYGSFPKTNVLKMNGIFDGVSETLTLDVNLLQDITIHPSGESLELIFSAEAQSDISTLVFQK